MDDKIRIFWLAVGVLAACFLYFFLVTFLPIPSTGNKYADMVVPFLLGSGVGVIVGFHWGSSEGSQEKNKLLAGAKEEPKP
jgi:hypothetical protein